MKIISNTNATKKLLYFVIIVILFITLFVLFFMWLIKGDNENGNNKKDNKNTLIAVVDGTKVYSNDLDARMRNIANGQNVKYEDLPEEILKAMVLESAINNKIDAEAKKLKYYKNTEINEVVDNYRKALIREKYLADVVYSKITDSEVLKEYNNLIESLKNKEERKIKHILVETEDEIERVRRSVMRTGNFEKVAKERSLDTASGENGGDIGYVLKEEVAPEFGDIAFILKVGEISKPVKTQYGWHIIKVEDVREAQFLPFEEVKDGLKEKLHQDAISQYLLNETKNSKIEFKIQRKKTEPLDIVSEETNSITK